MVLSALSDKWSQDKINIAYNALETCIATTKQRETVQPYFELKYTGDLASFSVQCPRPVRAYEPVWATNLCDNTVMSVGVVCSSGTVVIDSSCLFSRCYDTLTFCEELRYANWDCCYTDEDYYRIIECPMTTYCNCVWTGSSKQYQCRNNLSDICRYNWQSTVMCFSVCCKEAECATEKNTWNERLTCLNSCYGTWELPFPCFTCCTFSDVCHKQIQSLAYVYETPDGNITPYCCYTIKALHNSASQCLYWKCYACGTFGYQSIQPQCYIGWSDLPYCYGNESAICFPEATVSPHLLGYVCRVIDVYIATDCSSISDRSNLYNINMKILCRL